MSDDRRLYEADLAGFRREVGPEVLVSIDGDAPSVQLEEADFKSGKIIYVAGPDHANILPKALVAIKRSNGPLRLGSVVHVEPLATGSCRVAVFVPFGKEPEPQIDHLALV